MRPYGGKCYQCGATIPQLTTLKANLEHSLIEHQQYFDTVRPFLDQRVRAVQAAAQFDRSEAEKLLLQLREQREAQRTATHPPDGLGAPANDPGQLLRSELETASAILQRPASGMPWESWPSDGVAEPANTTHPFFFVGRFHGDGTPVFVPLLGRGHLFVHADHQSLQQVSELLLALAMRALAAAPPGQLTLSVYDELLLLPFGDLSPLASPGLLRTTTSAKGLDDMLEDLSEKVARAAAELDTRADTPALPRDSSVLVLIGTRALTRAASLSIERLLRRGNTAGVTVVTVTVPEDGERPQRSDVTLRPEPTFTYISVDKNGEHRVFAPWLDVSRSFAPALLPPGVGARQFAAHLARSAESRQSNVPLSEVLPEHWWDRDSTDGISVPLGRAMSGALELTLGGSEGDICHHVLIGGQSGSGKSTLLLTLVYGLAARYAPSELQLMLLDFKESVEFARFAPRPGHEDYLPHASVVSLESDPSIGISVLQHLGEVIRGRSEQFRAAGVSTLVQYRDLGHQMPRIVLIVDEFQGFFSGSDKEIQAAGELLADIARKGRSFGIHLVLASQTLAGINFGSIGTKTAVFQQFPARIALQMDPEGSRAILGEHNDRAADLRFRGHAILNTRFGRNPDDNRLFVAAHGSARDLQATQQKLYEAALDSGWQGRPRLFTGQSPASIDPVSAPHPDGLPSILVGEGTGVDAEPQGMTLKPTVGCNLLILGRDRRSAVGAYQAASLNLAVNMQASRRLRVLLFDSFEHDEREWASISRWTRALESLGARVETSPPTDGALLDGLASHDGITLVVAHRLDTISFATDGGQQPNVADLVANGPSHNVYVIAHCDDSRTLKSLIPAALLQQTFRTRLLVNPVEHDRPMRSPVPPRGWAHRGLLYRDDAVTTVATFEPFVDADFDLVLHEEGGGG